jgi:hypothetical protein
VDPGVIDLGNPGGEQRVQLGQAAHRGAGAPAAAVGAVGDLDQELVTDRAKKPLDFPSTSGFAGLRVGELDPEYRARPAELVIFSV